MKINQINMNELLEINFQIVLWGFGVLKFWSLGVDAISDDDDLSHIYLPNFKQL